MFKSVRNIASQRLQILYIVCIMPGNCYQIKRFSGCIKSTESRSVTNRFITGHNVNAYIMIDLLIIYLHFAPKPSCHERMEMMSH